MAAMVCTSGHALAFDVRSGQTRQIPLAPQRHGLALLVVDTMAHHALADGAYAQRRASCEAAAAALGVGSLREADPGQLATLADPLRARARHVVSEIARVEQAVAALQQGDLRRLGQLMNDSHVSLRDDFEVSCAELDLAVAASLDAGAWGARMTGGGFGGSAIVRPSGCTRYAWSGRAVQQGRYPPRRAARCFRLGRRSKTPPTTPRRSPPTRRSAAYPCATTFPPPIRTSSPSRCTWRRWPTAARLLRS